VQTLPFCGVFENGFVVVTALDEDTVAIVDVMTAASLVVGFVDGTEVTFDVVTAAALVKCYFSTINKPNN
jgi:hypothetical protein